MSEPLDTRNAKRLSIEGVEVRLPLTPAERADLRQKAEEATPGPWEHVPFSYEVIEAADCEHTEIAISNDSVADATYIAAISPDRLLALLDEVERLEQRLSEPQRTVDTMTNPPILTPEQGCPDPVQCCRELSRVWKALGIFTYTGRSASEEVEALRQRAAEDAATIARLTADRDAYMTLAAIGQWHAECRPNRHKAAEEIQKSQRRIDALASDLARLTQERDEAREALNTALDCPSLLCPFEKRAQAAESALAALREATTWQPIESAPINTAMLVFVPHWEHYGPGIYRAIRVNFGPDRAAEHWHSSAWSCGRDFSADTQPTHWMPLPPPPPEEPR